MILDTLFEFLSDKRFQNPDTGKLFFPAYIYTYDPKKEYQVRDEINTMIEKLKRPNNYLDCLVMNIYKEFITYLKNSSFNNQTSLFEDIINMEKKNPKKAKDEIHDEIDNNFIKYIETKVKEHFRQVGENKRVYLIVYGFGSIYPYLRASTFLKRTEALIKNFKIIVFYPGNVFNKGFSLFNQLTRDKHQENIYHVNNINKVVADEKN